MQKPAQAPIHSLLDGRWSPCAFAPEPIAAADITALCEAARWAPSCYGAQPWFFVLCDRHAAPQAWQKALDCLTPPNQAWAQNTSLLIAVCAARDFAHNGKPNRHHAYDSGAAALALVLQAEALGLRGHQMGGFDPDKTRAAFSVPDDCECLSFIAIGRQAPASALEGDLRARDEAPRQRKPLAENFFHGEWGAGRPGG